MKVVMQKMWNQFLLLWSTLKQLMQSRTWLRRSVYGLIALFILIVVWKIVSATLGWSDPKYKTAAIEEGPLSSLSVQAVRLTQ